MRHAHLVILTYASYAVMDIFLKLMLHAFHVLLIVKITVINTTVPVWKVVSMVGGENSVKINVRLDANNVISFTLTNVLYVKRDFMAIDARKTVASIAHPETEFRFVTEVTELVFMDVRMDIGITIVIQRVE